MIRAVFFDLFGTLFIYGDMKKAWSEWLHFFYMSMQDCGLKISKQEFSKECNHFFAKEEPKIVEDNMTVLEKRIKALSSSLNLNVIKEDISCIADLIASKWQDQIILDPNAVPIIQQLKKSKTIGLVSNFDHPPHVRRYLSKYNMDTLFDTVVISGEVGVKKPDPGIFQPALAETNMNAFEVAYIGDTEEDIHAAIAANMRPVLIQRKNGATDKIALDFTVDHDFESDGSHIYASKISSLPELISLFG